MRRVSVSALLFLVVLAGCQAQDFPPPTAALSSPVLVPGFQVPDDRLQNSPDAPDTPQTPDGEDVTADGSTGLDAAVSSFKAKNRMKVRRITGPDGKQIDEIVVDGRPPEHFRMTSTIIDRSAAAIISGMPAFDWSYGCSATSAAMIAAYYDRNGFPSMYNGPTNGGVMPLNNSSWGAGECPLSATHMGKDGRATRGAVDDYWVAVESTAQDPYITNGWTRHAYADCTGDFMGTNQSALSNIDGATTFYNYTDGTRLDNYTGAEPSRVDGCHGLRDFFESRGYVVTANFNQYIVGYNGNTAGFTYDEYKAEIDAGRPVMIQVDNHTMVGYGYQAGTSTIYIHDTWDYSDHSMTWGGSYGGLNHYGVSVFRIKACECSGVSQCCDGCYYTTGSCNADSSGCTVNDTCSAGVCVAGSAANCASANDQCNVGYCSSTGNNTYQCLKNPAPKNNLACNADSSGCTQGDKCVSGTCVAGAAPDCSALDETCAVGACSSTGNTTYTCVRSTEPKNNAPCDADSNGCTQGDKCSAGICVAGNVQSCSQANDQCNVGYCNPTGPTTFECLKNPGPKEGGLCDLDSSGCTPDVCVSGSCQARPQVDCSGLDQTCAVGKCESLTIHSYRCVPDPAPRQGMACDADSDGCTIGDKCVDGSCTAGTRADCSAMSDQCNIGTCVPDGPDSYQCMQNASSLENHPCNADSNGCTANDRCVAGACIAGPAPNCSTATDACNVGTCSSTGNGSYVCVGNPFPKEGLACDLDGDGCTQDQCNDGACTAGLTPDCSSLNSACSVGVCDSTGSLTYTCVRFTAPFEGTSCDADGNGCTAGDKCVSGNCRAGTAPDCSAAGDQCNVGQCVSTGSATYDCTPNPAPRNGSSCNADNDGCTAGDTCADGTCVAGTAPDCGVASDQCNVGFCSSLGPQTFECRKNPVPLDGAGCNADGNGCTVGDMCQAGTCTAGPAPDCSSLDGPCANGICQSTGAASFRCTIDWTPFQDMACNADNSGCTIADKCRFGTCVAGPAADCSAFADQCHAGACDPDGPDGFTCRADAAAKEGARCNADGNGCTVGDTCVSGTCTVGPDADCTVASDACNAGSCWSSGPNSFICEKDPAPREGLPCDADGDGCTVGDACVSGSCAAGSRPDCSSESDQCNTGICKSTSNMAYVCIKDPAGYNGRTCDADDNGCTTSDYCQSGSCVVGNPVDCGWADDQCNIGYCQSAGPYDHECLLDPLPLHGLACNADDDGCTLSDRCDAGACVAGLPADCSELDAPCSVGICESTGVFSFACVADFEPFQGEPCNADDDGCTMSDACILGECVEGQTADCGEMDDQCNAGYCLSGGPDSFSCQKDPRPFEGLSCNADDDGCTAGDSCLDGACVAGDTPDCSGETDQCNVGTCVAAGADDYFCMADPSPLEGHSCDADTDGCTIGDFCGDGTCHEGPEADCTMQDDQCNTGICESTGSDSFQCVSNPIPHEGAACDSDGSGCTVGDACEGGVCAAGDVPDCSSMTDQCNAGECRSTGTDSFVCVKNPEPRENTLCNADSNGCTEGDRCVAGACTPGAPPDCSAVENQCTASICQSRGPTTHACLADTQTLSGTACDDGDQCSTGDKCQVGSCVGSPVVCADEFTCTTNRCDANTGACTATTDDAACDDSNPCTDDTCSALSGCENVNIPDWSECSGTDYACFAGRCEPTGPGDRCPEPIVLESGIPIRVNAGMLHQYLVVESSCMDPAPSGIDAFLSFVADAGHTFTLTIEPDQGVTVAVVFRESCQADSTCAAGAPPSSTASTIDLPQDASGEILVQVIFTDCGGQCLRKGAVLTITDTTPAEPAPETSEDTVQPDAMAEIGLDAASTDLAESDSTRPDAGEPQDTGIDMSGSDFLSLDANDRTDDGGGTGGGGCSSSGGSHEPIAVLFFLVGFFMIMSGAAKRRRTNEKTR